MARFGKYTFVIYLLSALAALELIALAAVLAGPAVPAAAAAETAAVPEQMPAWLEPAPQREELPEEKDPPPGERTAAEILEEQRIIAHGMGAIAGRATLNCLEGFQAQYENGVRVFEVDLRLTADQQVVLRHDWRAGWQAGVSETSVPTLEQFLDKPLLGRFTPLSFQDLLRLMEQYPDVCVVTDTKFTDAEIVKLQFEAMVRDGAELGLSYLFDRMIIQVYDQLMFRVVDSVRHFDYYIYTLYTDGFARTEADFREKADFCAENGIMGITMWDYWWREDYAPIAREKGLKVFAHTVNAPEQALALLAEGVSAVYTDELTPGDLTEEPETGAENQASAEEGEKDHGADGKDTIQREDL